MASLRLKWIGRRDPGCRMVRLCRVMWEHGTVGDGKGYSAKLSLALHARLLDSGSTARGWHATVAGLRLHYARAYGGRFS